MSTIVDISALRVKTLILNIELATNTRRWLVVGSGTSFGAQPLHFQVEVHARIQGSWCNYSKSDGNFRHVWLRNMTNDDGIFRHVR